MPGALLEMPRRSDNSLRIGPRLKVLRERHGLTQEEVAQRLGLTADGYRHREHGRSKMNSLEDLNAYAGVFGLTLPELLVALGLVPPSDVPESEAIDHITPMRLRRWLTHEYGLAVAHAVGQMIDLAEKHSESDVLRIAEIVQMSLGLIGDRRKDD